MRIQIQVQPVMRDVSTARFTEGVEQSSWFTDLIHTVVKVAPAVIAAL